MEFSESFGFGNSTLLSLENQEKHELHGSEIGNLEAIQESPTKTSGNRNILCKNKSRLQTPHTSYKSKFRRSKSDSTIQRIDSAGSNYSDFFESDFSFSVLKKNAEDATKEEDNYISVSKLEAALINVTEHSECSDDLETPIFSEDINEIINKTTIVDNPVIINALEEASEYDIESEQCFDEASFICPDLAKATEASLKGPNVGNISSVSEKPKKDDKNYEWDKSLSCMSPEQLKWASETPNNENQIKISPLVMKNNKLKKISAWNLPNDILAQYKKKGIEEMFDWQVECLSNAKVLFEHCNLVYSAPTSAGKTLVSEIILVKTVLERQKKVLVILPFISVVREKMMYLQELLTSSGYRVEGFFGGSTPPGGFESVNIAICTIEKANSIVNKLLEQGKLDEVGAVVVDEVHLISDRSRGYILELLLAKILYVSRKFDIHIQVITMSATLSNVELLRKWLQAEIFITYFRPVALKEMIKIETKIYDDEMKFIRDVRENLPGRDMPFPTLPNDGDHIGQLCIETILEGCSVIVFCPSKDWCENLSVQLAGAIHYLLKNYEEIGNAIRKQISRDSIDEVKKQLKDIPTGLDSILEKTVTYGCAFHHAGLTTEERDIIETRFKSGHLKIIVATSTLSSGVNLPARRVIIRSPLFGGKQMSSLTYKQMIGRAGRTGQDTLGESILVCTESNSRIGKDLINANIKPITSCLEMDSSTHLKRALLEVISAGVAQTKEDIQIFFNSTLLSIQKQETDNEQCPNELEENKNCIHDSLNFLIEYEFIRLQEKVDNNESIYIATRLGMACLASSMPPTDGLLLFAELQKARRCFVLESELHAVYLVTPYSVCYQLQDLDWLLFLDMWERLSPSMKKVGELVGVKESFLVRAMRGQSKLDFKLIQIHKRFYTSLALQELVNETPINTVAIKYKCNRGMLQSLQQMASTFAGIVTAFCNSLKWSTLSLIVSQFKERLYFGIHHDLIDLMRLSDLTQKRARALFDAGITTLIELANADILDIEKILHNSLSFDLDKQHDNEDNIEAEKRKMLRNFFITGKTGITVKEAAKFLIEQARQHVQYEIGVNNINWSQEKNCSVLSSSKNELHMSYEDGCLTLLNNVKEKKKADLVKENNLTPNQIHKLENKSPQKSIKKEKALSENAFEINSKSNSGRKDKSINIGNEILRAESLPKECISKESCSEKILFKSEIKLNTNTLVTNIQKDVDIKYNQENMSSGTALLSDAGSDLFVNQICSKVQNKFKNDNLTKSSEKQKVTIPTDENNDQCESQKSHSNRILENNHKTVPTRCLIPVQDYPSNEKNVSIPNSNFIKEQTQSEKQSLIKDNCHDEKPSTSKEARRVLIEERRKQALALKNKKRVELVDKKTNSPQIAVKSETTSLNLSKRDNKENEKINMAKSESKSPSILNIETQKNSKNISNKRISSPRRSPRFQEKFKNSNSEDNIDDMFTDSFEMNSELNNVLRKCTDSEKQSPKNKSFDEIPASQQQVEAENCQTPHSSRFFRLHRTQHLETPKVLSSKKIVNEPETKTETIMSNSDSISLSDLSLENSLIKNPVLLNASHIMSCSKVDDDSSNFNCIEIIDICGNENLFREAFKELVTVKTFGFSIGLQHNTNKPRPVIGSNLLINQAASKEAEEKCSHKLFEISDSSFVEGVSFCIAGNIAYFMNMQEENSCKTISTERKSKCLKELFMSDAYTFQIFDAKEQLKILNLMNVYPKELKCNIEDPKMANWILQPDKNLHLQGMAQQFAPECSALINLCGKGRGYSSCGLDYQSSILAKVRCCIESCVTIHILKGQNENLERIGTGQLLKFFKEIEMPIQISLCNMEIYGFPVSEDTIRSLFQKMTDTMKQLENKIFEFHGSRFNLGSSSAVARVLGLHKKSNGKVSTSKQILEKLDSPISQMIMSYRKLSATMSKNIQPLLKCAQNNKIHGQSITLTSTGRISMVEPNLQNVAKDFYVDLGTEKVMISCRNAFYASDKKRCLLSSDFCQLEMRILSHLSQDPTLLRVMKSGKDIFKAIASRWNNISEDLVTEQLRNGTKQICYGVIYGMGMRSLAESLKCTEQEAKMVSEQFHNAYPGIRVYADKVVKFAKNNGYVETITGRRRYLEHINSEELHLKSQAERQAINSTIQGSAADIAKSAILRMEKNIIKYREKLGLDVNSVRLVLHLHDELVFEVPSDKARKIAKVLSLTMENCVKLSVPLKVKLKIGPSWGELKEIKL